MILELLGFVRLSLVDLLDILVVAVLIYITFRWIRHSAAMNIFIAIILLFIVRFIAAVLNMKMLSTLLGTVLDIGAVALVVIFQPELRQFLNRIGRSTGLQNKRGTFIDKLLGRKDEALRTSDVAEITEACKDMSDQKVGALIVILHRSPLQDIINTGDTIDADIRTRLIENIFFKNSPLHDGAMIIGGGRIIAARCTLPITGRTDIPARYGMRHKAAIGISEASDADVVVVSEQTGTVSFVRNGVISVVESKNDLMLLLSEAPAAEKEVQQ